MSIFKTRHSLSQKLLVRILLLSSAFTLLLTSSQLYLEFKSETALIVKRMQVVADQYIAPLVNELWEVDTEQINVMVKSIHALQDVTYVELLDNTFSKKSISLGERLIEQSELKSYPLLYQQKNQEIVNLGVLNVEFTYSNIISKLQEEIVLIFISQFFKTLVMSLFIFLIIQRLVIHHINDIARYLSLLRLDTLDSPLILNRAKNKPGKRDELDRVANSVNGMRAQLSNEMANHEQSRQIIVDVEQRSNTILNSLSEGVISYDLNGVVIAINAAAERMTGWSTADAVGQQIRIVFNCIEPDPKGHSPEQAASLVKAFKLVSRQGETRWIVTSKAPVIAERVRIFGTVMVIRDITREYHLRQSAHHNDKLRALGQLSSGIAHDLNNILAVITGASELLATQDEMSEPNKKLLRRISNSSLHGGQIINRLLTFSQKGTDRREVINIHKVINDALEMLNQRENKHISISIELNASNTSIMGDPSSLGSCLMNLGLNAIHSMASGGELLIRSNDVTVPSQHSEPTYLNLKPGQYVSIELSDTGAGIDPDIIAYIFEPFFTTKQNPDGIGLGLWIVYGAVLEHNGNISVQSELGKGSTFQVLLPVISSDITQSSEPNFQRSGNETILLIDDERLVLETQTSILESLNYRVIPAQSGKEAIAIYRSRQQEIDIIILDLIMPETSGIETLKALREINEQSCVMISSGYSDKKLQDELKTYLHIHTLKKPHSRRQLNEALKSILKKENTRFPLEKFS